MTSTDSGDGGATLRRGLDGARGPLAAVALFSAVVNLLVLTGPIYMLQVYDRVLTSRSADTLFALSLIAACLFLAMGMLDQVRARIMVRIAARFRQRLEPQVFAAALRSTALGGDGAPGDHRDLDAVQRLIVSPALMALCDLPWTPLFLALLFAFHPSLGVLAVAGGMVLVALALLNQRVSRGSGRRAALADRQADRMADALIDGAETVRALGMGSAAFARVARLRARALVEGTASSEAGVTLAAASRTARLFLQSAILGLGAWLVLRGAFSPGAMIAASVLLGRALAPVEQVVAQWPTLAGGAEAWKRLRALLAAEPVRPAPLPLPRPRALLDVQGLAVAAPGVARPAIRDIAFRLVPGSGLGVIGPSGSGKSTLARALAGVWPPQSGSVRLDGARLDHYGADTLGGLIGYLPQRASLFDGTVADNIARLATVPDPAAVIAAARAAGAHDMILRLPLGYDTPLDGAGAGVSGGQAQRIALARALYGDPVLLILDEPEAGLDGDGTLALAGAIRAVRARGGAVVVMAHRPQALQTCETLLVLREGRPVAFGPRESVLRAMLRSAAAARSVDAA